MDSLSRGIIDDLNIRFCYASLTDIANNAILQHNLDPVGGNCLISALATSVVHSQLLQKDEVLSFKWQYHGLLKHVQVEVNHKAEIRGFLNKDNFSNAADITELFGEQKGLITTVKSLKGKIIKSSHIQAPLKDILDDLSLYYALSDQIETAYSLNLRYNSDTKQPVMQAKIFFIQALPTCNLVLFDKVRQIIKQENFKEVLNQEHDLNVILTQLITLIEKPSTFKILDTITPKLSCPCTKDSIQQILNVLPKEEINDILTKKENLNISCQFCSTKYHFSYEEISLLT